MLTIQKSTERNNWDTFVEQFPHVSFLQSWSWGEFIKQEGGEALYWLLRDGQTPVGASLIVVQHSKRGLYLECVGGPLFDSDDTFDKYFDEWIALVKKVAQEKQAIFLRLRLPHMQSSESMSYLASLGFKETKLYYQAELSRQINLTQDEDTLFSQMKKKTRYEIRRSERDGVSVEKLSKKQNTSVQCDDAFETFLSLYHEMVERQQYVGYSDTYLKDQFSVFFDQDQASLYIASYQDKPVAASIFFHYGDTTTYHHSASIPVSKISPQSVILWHAMKDAKEQGDTWFDLFGIAPDERRYRSRIGLSQFKEGFGGQEWQWLRTHDVIFDMPRYYLVQLIELLPGSLRRFGALVWGKIRKN